MEARIVELEIKCSFLEQSLDSLNELVLEQARELKLLNRKLELLEKRLADDGTEVGPHNDPPPHY